jgi:hypothetical protein
VLEEVLPCWTPLVRIKPLIFIGGIFCALKYIYAWFAMRTMYFSLGFRGHAVIRAGSDAPFSPAVSVLSRCRPAIRPFRQARSLSLPVRIHIGDTMLQRPARQARQS